MLGSAEIEHPKLISHKIIVEEFQPMLPRYLSVRETQTDRRADRRLVVTIPRSM